MTIMYVEISIYIYIYHIYIYIHTYIYIYIYIYISGALARTGCAINMSHGFLMFSLRIPYELIVNSVCAV